MSTRRPTPVSWGAILVAASALLVVVAAAAPWIEVPLTDGVLRLSGIDLADGPTPAVSGLLTAGLASVATLLALFYAHRTAGAITLTVTGLAIELVAVAVVVAPETAIGPTVGSDTLAIGHVGFGVVLTIIGGLGVLLGGVLAYQQA